MVPWWEIVWRFGRINGFGLGWCSGHCCVNIRHCWNLTLSADLTGCKVLCRGIDSTDGSSLMGSRSDGSLGDSSLIGGRGVSGCGDSGGVKNFLTSSDSFSGFSRSSANVLRN